MLQTAMGSLLEYTKAAHTVYIVSSQTVEQN